LRKRTSESVHPAVAGRLGPRLASDFIGGRSHVRARSGLHPAERHSRRAVLPEGALPRRLEQLPLLSTPDIPVLAAEVVRSSENPRLFRSENLSTAAVQDFSLFHAPLDLPALNSEVERTRDAHLPDVSTGQPGTIRPKRGGPEVHATDRVSARAAGLRGGPHRSSRLRRTGRPVEHAVADRRGGESERPIRTERLPLEEAPSPSRTAPSWPHPARFTSRASP
jgi:hypothetical protein